MRDHGMQIAEADEPAVISKLSSCNYYRLRGYWLTLENGHGFKPGTSFRDVADLYDFDAEIRHWLAEAIEPIEIKLRTQFAHRLALNVGADALAQTSLFSNAHRYERSIENLEREISLAKHDGLPCVLHNLEKYGALPVWAAVEVMSFGTLSKLLGNLRRGEVTVEIAGGFGVSFEYLKSWAEMLTGVRNVCAHGNRFYNRLMKNRAKLFREDRPYDGNKQLPCFLVIRQLYLRSWPDAWDALYDELLGIAARYPSVDLKPMGFPKNWQQILSSERRD